jgi:hypothetical protein
VVKRLVWRGGLLRIEEFEEREEFEEIEGGGGV